MHPPYMPEQSRPCPSSSPLTVGVHCPISWLGHAFCDWLGTQSRSEFRTIAVSDVSPAHPDVVVLFDMAPDVVEMPVESTSGAPLLYLVPAITPIRLLEAIKLNASAILSFREIEERALPTLSALACGGPLLPPTALLQAFPTARGPAAGRAGPSRCVKITVRELEIACSLARGESYKQIAERCYITASTVKFHVTELLSKLGLADRYAIADYFNRVLLLDTIHFR